MGAYERVQDYATAREWEVANVPYDTHTAFKIRNVRYNTGVSEDTFTVSNIQKGS